MMKYNVFAHSFALSLSHSDCLLLELFCINSNFHIVCDNERDQKRAPHFIWLVYFMRAIPNVRPSEKQSNIHNMSFTAGWTDESSLSLSLTCSCSCFCSRSRYHIVNVMVLVHDFYSIYISLSSSSLTQCRMNDEHGIGDAMQITATWFQQHD